MRIGLRPLADPFTDVSIDQTERVESGSRFRCTNPVGVCEYESKLVPPSQKFRLYGSEPTVVKSLASACEFLRLRK